MVTSPAPSDELQTFPAPVEPRGDLDEIRRQRLSELTRVTVVGILVRCFVIAAEFLGVWLVGSAALLVDGVASLFDVLSSLVLLAAIRFAARPPDDDHPFGHGRAEPLAGFQLGILLCGTGAWMALQNAFAVSTSQVPADIPAWLCVIPASATGLLGLVTLWVKRVGRQTQSSALLAEGVHFQVDTATSFLTTVTLLGAAMWQSHAALLDHLGASVLAVLMILLGAQAIRENLHQLLDRVPKAEEFERVRQSAMTVAGVIDVEKVRIQQAGPDAHVNIDIEVEPDISVAASHLIAQQVRAKIQTDWPFVRDVVVHVEPFYPGDH